MMIFVTKLLFRRHGTIRAPVREIFFFRPSGTRFFRFCYTYLNVSLFFMFFFFLSLLFIRSSTEAWVGNILQFTGALYFSRALGVSYLVRACFLGFKKKMGGFIG